jgi:hypothetical protein
MEGCYPEVLANAVVHECIQPLFHLLCRLVRKSHSEDTKRRNAVVFNEVGDAVCDDARFATAGAGQDKEGSVGMLDGFALDII